MFRQVILMVFMTLLMTLLMTLPALAAPADDFRANLEAAGIEKAVLEALGDGMSPAEILAAGSAARGEAGDYVFALMAANVPIQQLLAAGVTREQIIVAQERVERGWREGVARDQRGDEGEQEGEEDYFLPVGALGKSFATRKTDAAPPSPPPPPSPVLPPGPRFHPVPVSPFRF